MKTSILSTIFLLTIKLASGQRDTITSEITSEIQTTNTWKGACCDINGKPLNHGDPMNQVYVVKSFRAKTPIDVNIKSVVLGSRTVQLDIRYQDKIEGDTKIINLNDTTGIKLTVAKTVEGGSKKYLYKLQVYKKDTESNCWRPLTSSIRQTLLSRYYYFLERFVSSPHISLHTLTDFFERSTCT